MEEHEKNEINGYAAAMAEIAARRTHCLIIMVGLSMGINIISLLSKYIFFVGIRFLKISLLLFAG